VGVVVSPIAFVTEHVETLVELDHEYAALADNLNCPAYVRVPALGVEAAFIEALADLSQAAMQQGPGVRPGAGWRCGREWSQCPANKGDIA
jgi:ferrochelatase